MPSCLVAAATSDEVGDVDGGAAAARCSSPRGLAVNSDYSLAYFADTAAGKIKSLNLTSCTRSLRCSAAPRGQVI
jgi:hypothetical protein